MMTALQLRCLIRNDEAIVRHLADQLQGEDGVIDALPTPTGYTAEREAILGRLGDRLRILQHRRLQLTSLSAALPRACASRAYHHTHGDNSASTNPEPTAAAC